jgi:hypothetical protein
MMDIAFAVTIVALPLLALLFGAVSNQKHVELVSDVDAWEREKAEMKAQGKVMFRGIWVDKEKVDAYRERLASGTPASITTCAYCGRTYQKGQLACTGCGAPLGER